VSAFHRAKIVDWDLPELHIYPIGDCHIGVATADEDLQERVAFYHYQPFIDEIVRLEDDRKAGKILKPEHGSKDISDAVCGAVYGALTGRSGWLAPSKGKTTDHFDKQERKYQTDGKGNPIITQETKEPDDIITDPDSPFVGRSRSRIEQLKKQYGGKGMSEDMKWLMS